MKLVEFIRFNGTPIAINPDYVVSVSPSGDRKGETSIKMHDTVFSVSHEYRYVCSALDDSLRLNRNQLAPYTKPKLVAYTKTTKEGEI